MPYEILYESSNYKVTYVDNSSNVTYAIFNPLNSNLDNKPEFTNIDIMFGVKALKELGFSVITIQSSKNDWFQRPDMIHALNEITTIRSKLGTLITYGASMGGYAAINFATLLGANFYVAIAPQYSIIKKKLHEINDNRFDKYCYDSCIFEFISPNSIKVKGLVLYDPSHSDAEHIEKLKECSSFLIVNSYGSGHEAGLVVNQSYGLKNILSRLANGIFTDTNKLDRFVAEIEESCSKHPFYKITKYLSLKTAPLPEVISLTIENSFFLSDHTRLLLLPFFNKLESISEFQAMFIYSCVKKTKLIDIRKQASFILCRSYYIELALDLVKDPSLLLGYFDAGSSDVIIKYKKKIGADSFRNEAVRLMSEKRTKSALDAITIAKELRPDGGYIIELFNKYSYKYNK